MPKFQLGELVDTFAGLGYIVCIEEYPGGNNTFYDINLLSEFYDRQEHEVVISIHLHENDLIYPTPVQIAQVRILEAQTI